ncbi:MAG: hypothetical protein ACKOAC_06130, partial [Fluviibacter sp.]
MNFGDQWTGCIKYLQTTCSRFFTNRLRYAMGAKVHVEVSRMRVDQREIIMIGHKGHPEVEGTMGQSPDGMHLVETVDDVAKLNVRDPSQLAYVTQTTLSVDDAALIVAALRERFPEIELCHIVNRFHQMHA